MSREPIQPAQANLDALKRRMAFLAAMARPRSRRTLCLLAVATLIGTAGCISPGSDVPVQGPGGKPHVVWAKEECDPSSAQDIARDVPWIPSWQGTPEEVAARFAAAIGIELPPFRPEISNDRGFYWESPTAHVRYLVDDGEGPGFTWDELAYFTPEQWPGATSAASVAGLKGFLDRFGVPMGLNVRVESSGYSAGATILQYHEQRALWETRSTARVGDGSGRDGWWAGFDFRPIHDTRAAAPRLTPAEARETAVEYHSCVMARDGRTEETGYSLLSARDQGLQVRGASLVRQVMLHYTEPGEPGHCGFARTVNVDATTGAVYGWEWPPCD